MKKVVPFNIKFKTDIAHLLLYGLCYYCFTLFFISVFHFPGIIKYLGDFFNIYLFINIVHNKRLFTHKKLIAVVLFFGFTTIIVYCAKFYSFFLYVWGFRNVFAGYVYLLACIQYWEIEHIEKLIKMCENLFHINFILIMFEVIFGYRQDLLNGMYGISRGGNGYEGLFISIVFSFELTMYVIKKNSIWKTLYYALVVLFISAIAELKANFIFIIMTAIVVAIFTKHSMKKFRIYILGIVVILLSVELLYIIYPYFRNFFTVENIAKYLTNNAGYTYTGDFNRFGGLKIIYEDYLQSPFEKMFGLGLGFTEYSGIGFLNSSFYLENLNTHYCWFSDLMFFLENGIIGCIAYLMIFFVEIFCCLKGIVKNYPYKEFYILGINTALLGIGTFFLTSILRDFATQYMLYAFMAAPFVFLKNIDQKNFVNINMFHS